MANDTEIARSFKDGGYFGYKVPGLNFTVVSLNSMYPFFKNKVDSEMATAMLDWLDSFLSTSTGKFMLLTHVYPANNYFKKLEVFWETRYIKRLHEILWKYRERFVLSLGAHIH